MDYEGQEVNGALLSGAVQEARDYFEEYAANMELSDDIWGFSPGNFAPDWRKAVVTVDDNAYVTVNVPIVSERVYQGLFFRYYDPVKRPSDEVYWSAAGQKLVVVKDPATSNLSCYILTIIPDEARATTSYEAAAGMYVSGGKNKNFSGTTLFSVLGGPAYPVFAERYRNGERYAAASWWWNEEGYTQQLMNELFALVSVREFKVYTRTMTKALEGEELASLKVIIDEKGGVTFEKEGNNTGNTNPGSNAQQSTNEHYLQNQQNTMVISQVTPTTIGGTGNISPNVPGNTTIPTTTNPTTTNPIITNPIITNPTTTIPTTTNPITTNPTTTNPTTKDVPPSNANDNSPKSKYPSYPRPVAYPNIAEDALDVFANDKAKSIAKKENTYTQKKNECVPFVFSYANGLFGDKKNAKYYREDFKKPPFAMDIKWKGMDPQDVLNKVGLYFSTTMEFNSADKDKINYEGAIGKGYMIMTTIPDGAGEGHFILVVGRKANGDLIYIDPEKNYLQVVAPSYIEGHVCIIITGIKNNNW